MIRSIEIPSTVDQIEVPTEIASLISDLKFRIQTFQDQWQKPQIEQFVAADYELVYQTLRWVVDSGVLKGTAFLEWGCGFAVVTAMAAKLGLDSIGVEAEQELLSQANRFFEQWKIDAELILGNFLPLGADQLSDDPMLPSLGHPVACVYPELGMEPDDFALIYAYPWPGEEVFLQAVFDRYARAGAHLLLFCGPYDLRLFQKSFTDL